MSPDISDPPALLEGLLNYHGLKSTSPHHQGHTTFFSTDQTVALYYNMIPIVKFMDQSRMCAMILLM